MNRFNTRAAAAALALILGVSPVASASQALGDDLRSSSVSIGEDTCLTSSTFWSNTYSDLRSERYITYKPNSGVTPAVCFGESVLTKSTLTEMAQSLEAEGKRVVGGLNGDYFVVSTGQPLGMVITDGVLRSSASYLYAVGFDKDGSVFIGQPELSVTATFSGHTLIVAGVNKVRTSADGYFLLTDDFSDNTQNVDPGVDVILSPVLDGVGQKVNVDLDISDASAAGEDTASADEVKGTLTQSAKPTVGGRVTYRVEQVLQSTGSIPIPEGKAVLTINSKSNSWLVSELLALQPGNTVDLDITSADSRWATAQYALGGMYKLVTNGAAENCQDVTQAPRSAVGIKPDGTAVFYTLDGRQSGYSVGATLNQVAQRLIELGCTEAVCLDGGGSTTIGVTYPDGNSIEVINKPSDGTQRSISNAIFFLSNLNVTGVLDHYYVTPGDAMLLAGASVQLTANPVDTAWYPMKNTRAKPYWTVSGEGTVTSDGIFTAGTHSGVSSVTAAAGDAKGSAELTVVSAPDSVLLYDETSGAAVTSLFLEPGQAVDLKAVARYKKLTLTSQDPCFVWTADQAAGTVDSNGLFTAADKTGAGSLTVSAGGSSTTIPISVTGHVLLLEDFENENLNSLVGTSTVDISHITDAALVKYGKASEMLSYHAAATGIASAAASLNIVSGEKYLNLWVYGDGSGNDLTALISTSSGARVSIDLGVLDYTGWKYVTARLPEGASALSSFNISCAGGITSGVLYLDQITTSNEAVDDAVPPIITLSVDSGTVLASVVDDMTHSFGKDRIRVTCDGVAMDFNWDANEGIASAALPAGDGKLHRLTVTATDLCGNIARSSYDIDPTAEQPEDQPPVVITSPFTDMTGHWADKYATYLYDHGIAKGVGTDEGLQYQPQKNISRGEFFLMISRWMGLDENAYADVVLPFSDQGTIASWALGGVKAMYSLGYLKGSRDGDALNANANSPITRAEAMTLLGRIQAKGYARPPLTFDDSAEVPTWALPYVSSLMGQGVVGGYENKVHPSDPVKRGEVAKMLYMIQ